MQIGKSRKRHIRVAVPPGVGDTYWALRKIEAVKAAFGAETATLMVQAGGPSRALPWGDMTSLVQGAEHLAFRPTPDVLSVGYAEPFGPADCCLWPNAVLDRGERLETWLPDLPLNQVPITTVKAEPRAVVYASSVAINKAWLPTFTIDTWCQTIQTMEQRVGPVTLIGAGWDAEIAGAIVKRLPHVDNLVGKTPLPVVAGIIESATVVVGVISGMTILANHFHAPCINFYPAKHHVRFPWSWQEAGCPNLPVLSESFSPADLPLLLRDVMRM